MVYSEKTKRVIMLILTTVMLLTSIPIDVIAVNQGEYEDNTHYESSLRYEEEITKAEEQMKKAFEDKRIDSVVVKGYIYEDYMDGDGIPVGTGTIDFTVTMGDIFIASIKDTFDADAYKRGDRTSFDETMMKASTHLLTNALGNIEDLQLKLTEKELIELVETLLGVVNSDREQGLTYEIEKSENGTLLISITSNSGETVYIELKEGMTKEDATNAIQTEIQKLISTLNEELMESI